jgi:hypothetical protein
MSLHENIDARLADMGKDRAWLAQVTPYSADYIRTVLAPNSKRRTNRVMQILLDAIEREEAERSKPLEILTPAKPMDHVVLEISPDRHALWTEAANHDSQDLKPWAIDTINKAAEEWKAKQKPQLVAETASSYRTKNNGTTGNE